MGPFSKVLSCLFSPSLTDGEIYESAVFGVTTPGNKRIYDHTKSQNNNKQTPDANMVSFLRNPEEIDREIQTVQLSIKSLQNQIKEMSVRLGDNISRFSPTQRRKLETLVKQTESYEQGLNLLLIEYNQAINLPLQAENMQRVITSHQITKQSNRIMKKKMSEITIDNIDDALIEQEELERKSSELIGASTFVSDDSQRKLELAFNRILDSTTTTTTVTDDDDFTKVSDSTKDVYKLSGFPDSLPNPYVQSGYSGSTMKVLPSSIDRSVPSFASHNDHNLPPRNIQPTEAGSHVDNKIKLKKTRRTKKATTLLDD